MLSKLGALAAGSTGIGISKQRHMKMDGFLVVTYSINLDHRVQNPSARNGSPISLNRRQWINLLSYFLQ